MSELVTFSEEESYCLLHMDDGKANALGFDMFEAINAALDKAEQAGKVVLITGRPGKFSAGFDLSVMGGDPADMTRLVRTGAELSRRLLQFPNANRAGGQRPCASHGGHPLYVCRLSCGHQGQLQNWSQ